MNICSCQLIKFFIFNFDFWKHFKKTLRCILTRDARLSASCDTASYELSSVSDVGDSFSSLGEKRCDRYFCQIVLSVPYSSMLVSCNFIVFPYSIIS